MYELSLYNNINVYFRVNYLLLEQVTKYKAHNIHYLSLLFLPNRKLRTLFGVRYARVDLRII